MPFDVQSLSPPPTELTISYESCVFPGASTRHILFVCGPFGPFTRRLAKLLRATGARCSRVLLNGGDVLDWGLVHGPAYFGAPEAFEDWAWAWMRRERVTDIVTYGDAHPYCVASARAARALGVKVHVLEQGYFRPFWITLERDGVNGHSRLPRDPETYRRDAILTPRPREAWLPRLTPPAAWRITLHHAAALALSPLFPRYRAGYAYPVLRQALGHARRYLDQRMRRTVHERALARALEGPGPLFLVVLQRPGDSQLRAHSPFGSSAAFIETVVASFAAHAPPAARLLLKAHPLDHGLEPHGVAARAAAERHGVADRVFFSDIGDIHAVLPNAAGAVTVNSTAGLAAIEKGVPTVVLGRAIYDMPGLTHQDGLDAFWTRAQSPDPGLFDAFRWVVIARTQVSGAYAIAEGIDRAAPEVTRRLLTA